MVAAVGTFGRDLEGHVKQIFLEDQSVIVVRRNVDLRLFVGGQLEQTDNFRDGGHGDDAGGDGVSAGGWGAGAWELPSGRII